MGPRIRRNKSGFDLSVSGGICYPAGGMSRPRRRLFEGGAIALPMGIIIVAFFLLYNFVVGYGKDDFYMEVESWLATESRDYVHTFAAMAREYSTVDLQEILRGFDAQANPSPNTCTRTLAKMYEAIGEYEKTKAKLFNDYKVDMTLDREFLRIYVGYKDIASIRPSFSNFKYASQKRQFNKISGSDVEAELRKVLAYVKERNNNSSAPAAP